MPLHALFYFVLLSQVLLISLFLPTQLLARVRHIVERYPPTEYPKLYPVPLDAVQKAQRNYRYMNRFALIVGLVLVAVGLLIPTDESIRCSNGPRHHLHDGGLHLLQSQAATRYRIDS